MSCATNILLSGRLNGWLADNELRMLRFMDERWLEEYTAKELCRNATIREKNHRKMQLHHLRFVRSRFQRERILLDALAERFGSEARRAA